jgi:hypothetical protein
MRLVMARKVIGPENSDPSEPIRLAPSEFTGATFNVRSPGAGVKDEKLSPGVDL